MREAAEIAAGLNKRRADWLLSLPLTLTEWEWSERFARRVVDYCVNQGLATWGIVGDPFRAEHTRTPLGEQVAAHIRKEKGL